jgi:hypothetical protein
MAEEDNYDDVSDVDSVGSSIDDIAEFDGGAKSKKPKIKIYDDDDAAVSYTHLTLPTID